MSSFTSAYYNDYTNNPSPAATDRLNQQPPYQRQDTFLLSSNSRFSNWSKYLWLAFVIFACICLFVAIIVPLVIVLRATSLLPSTG